MKENEIIQSLYPPGQVQGDDCYLYDENTILTTDTIVQDTHFTLEWFGPAEIASKAVEVNVSDIAAGGGVPTKCLLNLGLSPETNEEVWLKAFMSEFQSKLQSYDITLVGGDTYKSSVLSVTLTLFGRTHSPWNRSGGLDGDILYVTGPLGYSALGFSILLGEKKDLPPAIVEKALDKFLKPKSQLGLAQEIQESMKVHACMDITDGLIQDASRLANRSDKNLRIDTDKIPGIKELEGYMGIDAILSSGEELELLLLSPDPLPEALRGRLFPIGRASNGKAGLEFLKNGKLYVPQEFGFEHF